MSQSVANKVYVWMEDHQEEMISFIKQLVSIETPSDVPASQQPALELLTNAFAKIHYKVRRIPGRHSGGHLFARPLSRDRNKPVQLLLGHCDTVWPIGTIQDMPLKVKDGKMHGPGIYDMKTGLTQIIFVLRALQELRLEPPVTPVVFINSDEEIGSRESATYIHRLARLANRSLVTEPSLGPRGRLKTARKGVGRFTIKVQGKAAHAGLNPEQGASAILELAKEVNSLYSFKKRQVDYLEKLMEETTPNLKAVAGVTIGAKLLAHAGTLKRLMMMPASTVQLLGAEKALFRHMKNKKKFLPPKYGILHEHPLISRVSEKGKAARSQQV